ncbi:hypothetical protein ACIRU2_03850 [Streptomyces sp. NPDC101169]|uniref:hypothetical protein n=1 Tax=Streptomyces sp. NPDC101169 TaxID=3366121 RepID=UPI00380EE107
MLFLNEKSCVSSCRRDAVDTAMREFVALLKGVRDSRRDLALVTELALKDLELAPGYPLSQWAAHGRNRDLWRFVRTLQNHAPSRSVVPDDVSVDEVEYRHDGAVVHGLAAAHLLDQLAVSLPVEQRWDAYLVTLDRQMMVEEEDGAIGIRQDRVDARHASRRDHADMHHEWIRRSGLDAVTTGTQLWERRADFFPHLDFLPRTEADLADLRKVWLAPAKRLLLSLEESAALWRPAEKPEPDWKTHITPESTSRFPLCTFPDVDGRPRTFSLHGRMTPGHGRLHFALVPGSVPPTLRIAYIGAKRLEGNVPRRAR